MIFSWKFFFLRVFFPQKIRDLNVHDSKRENHVFLLLDFCWFKIHQFSVTDVFLLLGHCVQTEIQSKFIQHVFIFGGRLARTYLQII